MNVTPLFTQEELQRAVEEQTTREINALVRELQIIGEQVVTEARVGAKKFGKDYLTQTGNLRSSIGYVITLDGQPVTESSFHPVAGSESGKEGADKGREFAREVASELPGLAIVVVAGMNYASYVHNKGYDVLDSAELVAKQLMDDLITDY